MDLITMAVGGTSVIATCALAVSETGFPFWSTPDTFTTSVLPVGPFERKFPVKLHWLEAPGASVTGTTHVVLLIVPRVPAGHVDGLATSFTVPYLSSQIWFSVTLVNCESFVWWTVNANAPPGSGREVGSAVFVTVRLPTSTKIGTLNPMSQLHFEGDPGYASNAVWHVVLFPDVRQLVQFGRFRTPSPSESLQSVFVTSTVTICVGWLPSMSPHVSGAGSSCVKKSEPNCGGGGGVFGPTMFASHTPTRAPLWSWSPSVAKYRPTS